LATDRCLPDDPFFFRGITLNTALKTDGYEISEQQIAAILEYRFGDGLVYLPRNSSNHLYSLAKKLGFIDIEGYLTRKGRSLLARHYFS